jgi:hypothetical protein
MAVTYGAVGTGVGHTNSSVIGHVASIGAGDLLLIYAFSGDSANSTPGTPATWTLLATAASTEGTWGNQTGPRRVTIFYKIAAGGETGNVTVAIPATANSLIWARMERWDKTLANWLIDAYTDDYQTSQGTFTSLIYPGVVIANGDQFAHATASPDASTGISGQAFAASGITFGTVTENGDSGQTNGNDMRLVMTRVGVTAGSGTQTVTYTQSQDVPAAGILIRLGDTNTSGEALSASVSDALTATAAGSQVSPLSATLSDALTATSAGAQHSPLSAAASDALTATAAGAQHSPLSAALSDALSATAAASLTTRLSASASDALTATASGSVLWRLSANPSDALTATAAGSTGAPLSAALSDTLAATAAGTTTSRLSAVLSDALSATAAGSASGTLSAALSDALTATASGLHRARLSAAVSDSLTATAAGSARSPLSASLSDGLTATAVGSIMVRMSASSIDALTATAFGRNMSDIPIPGVTPGIAKLGQAGSAGSLSRVGGAGKLRHASSSANRP